MGGVNMSTTANINVRTDAELKTQAQKIFESMGLDLSTAVNLFLKQTVRVNNLPFVVGVSVEYTEENIPNRREAQYGVWKGKYSLPENFDAPFDDFNEYM